MSGLAKDDGALEQAGTLGTEVRLSGKYPQRVSRISVSHKRAVVYLATCGALKICVIAFNKLWNQLSLEKLHYRLATAMSLDEVQYQVSRMHLQATQDTCVTQQAPVGR